MPDYNGGAPLWARFVNKTESTPRPLEPQGWTVPEGCSRLPPPQGAQPDCPLPFDWESRKYAALDVETTGLDPWRDRVIEIGVVRFSFDSEGALVEEDTWNSLINPGIAIPESATAIHGITDLDISSSPFFREIASGLATLLGGRVMVAHNAPFDAGFIREEFSRLSREAPVWEMADSLVLLRQAFPNLLSYNLGKAAFILGIDSASFHRALDDARTCMHIFVQSARRLSGACP